MISSGQKILHSELGEKDDDAFEKHNKYGSQKKEVFGLFQRKEKTINQGKDESPLTREKNRENLVNFEHDPTETAHIINQSLWEWLNLGN